MTKVAARELGQFGIRVNSVHPGGVLTRMTLEQASTYDPADGAALLESLPIDFNYVAFAVLLFFTGLTMASFGSPNRAGVMNSLPPEHRGAGSGMNTTFQNSAQVISIGVFFTLIIVGLSGTLPHNVSAGLLAHGVPRDVAERAHPERAAVPFRHRPHARDIVHGDAVGRGAGRPVPAVAQQVAGRGRAEDLGLDEGHVVGALVARAHVPVGLVTQGPVVVARIALTRAARPAGAQDSRRDVGSDGARRRRQRHPCGEDEQYGQLQGCLG